MANIKGFTLYFNVIEPYTKRATDEQIGYALKQAIKYARDGEVEYTGEPYQDTIIDSLKGCVDYSMGVANNRGYKNKPKPKESPKVEKPQTKETLCYGDGTPMETMEEVKEIIKRKTNINQ